MPGGLHWQTGHTLRQTKRHFIANMPSYVERDIPLCVEPDIAPYAEKTDGNRYDRQDHRLTCRPCHGPWATKVSKLSPQKSRLSLSKPGM